MKETYTSLQEFKNDLEKEYSFRDICEINSWIKPEEYQGQMIRCKFHHEKTASMQVGDHFFKCYGCGAKGDIFTFAERYNNYSFMEAVIEIANSVNVNIDISDKGFSSNEISRKRKMLKNEWDMYLKAFSEEVKTNKALANEARRFFPFDTGYDKKENRLVLAFMKNGEPLGFTKRTLVKDLKPKWTHSIINLTLTAMVNQIFNIDSLKGNEDHKRAYLVEGPGDVANMVRSGFDRTICCCGTSNFSDKVLDRILAENISSLVFAPDGDEAGAKARVKWCREIIRYDYVE